MYVTRVYRVLIRVFTYRLYTHIQTQRHGIICEMCLKTVKIPLCLRSTTVDGDGGKIRESCQGIQCIFDRDGHYPTPLGRDAGTRNEKRSLEKIVPHPAATPRHAKRLRCCVRNIYYISNDFERRKFLNTQNYIITLPISCSVHTVEIHTESILVFANSLKNSQSLNTNIYYRGNN